VPILVEEYVREDGAVPYQNWFDILDAVNDRNLWH